MLELKQACFNRDTGTLLLLLLALFCGTAALDIFKQFEARVTQPSITVCWGCFHNTQMFPHMTNSTAN